MATIPFTITPKSINVLIDGRMRTIDNSHKNYQAVRAVLGNIEYYEDPASELRDLLDIPSFIAKITEGRVQVSGSAVMFDGKQAHGVIVERILQNLNSGFDHYAKALSRFLDRVSNNPLPSAREELFIWLEHNDMPITEDGCLLAWKKVRDDYKSYHDGITDNSIGVKLPRMDDADTDRTRTCSRGYHFCSFSYLGEYMGDEGRVMIVKIDPADVAAIPNDYNNAKGRAYTYEIVGEAPRDEVEHFFKGVAVTGDYDAWPEDTDGVDDFSQGTPGEDYDDENYYDGTQDEDRSCGCGTADCPSGPAAFEAEADKNPETDAIGEPTFVHNGVEYSGTTIQDMVNRNGQRGVSRLLGVARTTLQGWLKRI